MQFLADWKQNRYYIFGWLKNAIFRLFKTESIRPPTSSTVVTYQTYTPSEHPGLGSRACLFMVDVVGREDGSEITFDLDGGEV